MSNIHFNPGHLMHEMMQHESLGVAAETAMRTLCNNIQLHSYSVDRKTFTFKLQSKKKWNSRNLAQPGPYLTLQVVKGSLHTLIWSTFARFDDEYALFFHLNDPAISSNTNMASLVWSIHGVDAVNSKISAGMIDWFMLRKIQSMLKITSIGLLAFSKLLGRFLISVPNYMKTRRYLPPMPATFMFNYLMVVCHCPFELGVSKLSRLLNNNLDFTTGFTMKRLLQTLIQPNGSGSWLLGYLPVRAASGGFVLQSRYYFEHSHATTSSADRKKDDSRDRSTSEQTEHPQSAHTRAAQADPPFNINTNAASSTDHTTSTNHPVNDFPTAEAASYSLQCARLMMETAVRVVELLPHPLGRGELVVVIEFVHNNCWSANTRFVALDVFKVGQAILLAGQPPPQFLSRIDILDSQGWYQHVQEFHSATSRNTSNSNTLGTTEGLLWQGMQPNQAYVNPISNTNTNTNNHTHLHDMSHTPIHPSRHHYHQQQQQQQQQHSVSPLPSYGTRTAAVPVGMDIGNSGTVSGLNSMFGSPMLDSLSVGMNLSAFSSPQPQPLGQVNTSGPFVPTPGATTASADHMERSGVPPAMSMDSYDNTNYSYNSMNTNNNATTSSTTDSRLHSAADIILRAASSSSSGMNSHNNSYSNNSYSTNSETNRPATGANAEPKMCNTNYTNNDNASNVSHSNNGYSTNDEHDQLRNTHPITELVNSSDNSSDDDDNDNNSDRSSSESSDEHNSTDLFIENIPAASSTRKSKQTKRTTSTTKPTKPIKSSKRTNTKSKHYYTTDPNIDPAPYRCPTPQVHGSKNRTYVDAIDFANSCEWGAPCLLKKNRHFYSDLLKVLLPLPVQQQSPPTGHATSRVV